MQNYGQDKHGLNSGSVVKMADKTTFIKLDRNIIYWRWYKNPKMLSVFIWLLVKANIKEGHFEFVDMLYSQNRITTEYYINFVENFK